MNQLVIGCGNDLLGDDGVGVFVVERLRGRGVPSGVELISTVQLTPETAEDMSRADVVYFIDASEGSPPGRCTWTEASAGGACEPLTAHEGSPYLLAALTLELYGRSPRIVVATIVGERFEPGEGLSPPVQAGAEEVISELERRLREFADCSRPEGGGRGRA